MQENKIYQPQGEDSSFKIIELKSQIEELTLNLSNLQYQNE
jgi:hypothetical protein